MEITSPSCNGSRFVRTNHTMAVLNETVLRGSNVVLDPLQLAFYLHVDDGLIMSSDVPLSSPDHKPIADQWMQHFADNLESQGFIVTDRTGSRDLKKVVEGVQTSPQSRKSP